jgi:bifunctional enzyme CysN/CysC
LFEDGWLAYYLGIGSVLYSVNADLKRKPQASDWHEHVRRFAEVCHLFLDAGIILIVTAVELTQVDLEILKTVIDAERIETIWLGAQITTDLECDIHLGSIEAFEQTVETIRAQLLEHGIIL